MANLTNLMDLSKSINSMVDSASTKGLQDPATAKNLLDLTNSINTMVGSASTKRPRDEDPEDHGTDFKRIRSDDETSLDGKPLGQILKERSISSEIIDKCLKYDIHGISDLRKLPFATFKKFFKTEIQCSFIDWKHLEGLWSGNMIPVDYIPPIRKQCIEHGIDLEYAEYFEKLNVCDLKNVTEGKLQEVMKIAEDNKPEMEDGEDFMETNIDDIRSAIGIVKDGKSRGTMVPKLDEDFLAAKEANLAEAQKSLESANQMRDAVKQALAGMDPQSLAKTNAAELKEKIASLVDLVQAPSEMEEVGKNFLGHDGLLEKVNTKALFDSSTDYIAPYTDDKDLLAAASGGLALTGIGMFLEKDSPLVGCTMPVLAPPDRVTTLGVFTPFESKILKTTAETEASSFQSRACSVGMSMARSMQSEASASASVSSRFASGSASASHARSSSSESSSQKDSNSSSYNNTKTQTAQITEYIMMPMRSFRIPRTAVKLSDEAIMDLRTVTCKSKAQSFFSKFGTHVSRGRHTLGGVFFRKISLTSDESLSANKMFSSAGQQLSKSKQSSTAASASAAGGGFGYQASAAASASFSGGSASSMGSVQVSSNDGSKASTSCTYTFDTRCMGPNASSPEEFAKILQSNNATWACIDRGDPTSLMPIWEIIETESRDINLFTSGEEDPMTNEEIASLLKESWLEMLNPARKQQYQTNPSTKNLLVEPKAKNELYKNLSLEIMEFAGTITYNDEHKYNAIIRGVRASTPVMKEGPKSFASATWIKSFLSLGMNKQNPADQKILKAMTGNVRAQKDAAALAAQFSTHDWDLFYAAFVEAIREYWSMQQEAKECLPAAGVKFKIVPSTTPKWNWDVDGGKSGNGTLLQNWTSSHLPAGRFMVDRLNDGSFRLIPTCATGSRVDVCRLGGNCHIWADQSKTSAFINQKLVLYKPMSTAGDTGKFVILAKKDMRYCVAFPNDKWGAKLKTTLLSSSSHSVCSFVPI